MSATAEFYSGPETQQTRFNGAGLTPMSVGSPLSTTPIPQTAQASGANLPNALTWFIGAVVLLFALKFLSEHDRVPLNPAHVHVGAYNVLTIFVIVVISVVGMKILVNRPTFDRGPLAGFKALVNAS